MKILLFIDNLGAGGAQRQLVGLAVMLKQRGYQVKVCYYQDTPFYAGMLDENGVPHELIQGSDNHKKRIPIVAKYFKKENPEWVIAFLDTPSLVASAAKVLGGKFKLIVSERNTTQKVGMNERVRFFLYRWADAIVPNSYAQEKWLKKNYSSLSGKITTITNFVDLDSFTSVSHQRRQIPEVMIAASIWAPKNTLGLIHACRLLKDKSIQVHFSWYGKSELNIEYYYQCATLIDELDVGDYIDLFPKTKEIIAKYQEADYFCLPSFYEGTPNVICEAISTGVPVMCSNVCDNPHYVIDGSNGILFDPKNPENMACKIEKILSQTDEEYLSYRKMSRSIAEEKLSQKVFIEKYLKLIER